MTTEQAEEEIVYPELPVTFAGREIFVRMPTPEQLLVWERTVKRLTEAPPDESWNGSAVLASLERLRKIVDSIFVNRTDIDWLDDQFLDRKLDFKALVPFITLVVDAFADAAEEAAPNREAKRAIKKTAAKKAARKKAVN